MVGAGTTWKRSEGCGSAVSCAARVHLVSESVEKAQSVAQKYPKVWRHQWTRCTRQTMSFIMKE
eukprot:3358178-Prymnesium_polylepis.1